MAKFKCLKCSKEIEISKFRTIYRDKKRINMDLNTNKEIICECGEKMELIPNEGNFTSTYSQFSTLSPLEKQKLLRKRSREDAKKQKYVEQEREKLHFNG